LGKRLRLKISDEHGHERLSHALVEQLLTALESETDATVVTLESDGPLFCEGMDLGELTGPAGVGEAPLERFATLLHSIQAARCPVIALVDGAARGGGVGLTAAADLVLATRSASFGLPETLFGLVPAIAFPVIARRIGPVRARWMALGAATLDATEAWRIGLVDEVVEDLEVAAARYIRRFELSDPRALGEVKTLAALHESAPSEYFERAVATFHRLALSPETRDRVTRFATGDAPWPGEVTP
jgi:enoyl-CoA hydratase/carnithine racemase